MVYGEKGVKSPSLFPAFPALLLSFPLQECGSPPVRRHWGEKINSFMVVFPTRLSI